MNGEAHFENRIYFFKLVSKTKDEIKVEMYSTPYTLVKQEDKWRNHNNKMNLTQGLVDAVVKAVNEAE
ncbi:MAG: hypothetical protein J0I41_03275 [Filimonas sp.]|nr:hypothetical protein [Filimonas sp.]